MSVNKVRHTEPVSTPLRNERYRSTDKRIREVPNFYLNHLVDGGLFRVYGLNTPRFSSDTKGGRNSVFTTLELRMAQGSSNVLQTLTESLLSELTTKIIGKSKLTIFPERDGDPFVEADLRRPFRRVSVYQELEKVLAIKLPHPITLFENGSFFERLCQERQLKGESPMATRHLLQMLIKECLHKKCASPTFFINYPIVMSPWTQGHKTMKGLCDRFELVAFQTVISEGYIIRNKDYCEPHFANVAENEETDSNDVANIEAMRTAEQYRSPPLAGWRLHVDQLALLFSQSVAARNDRPNLSRQ